jgi:hypothetical protein
LESDIFLTNESNAHFSLTSDHPVGESIHWKNQNVTIQGTDVVTLNLWNFRLNGSTLTLDGTAATQFVINVQHRFRITNESNIVLSGGVQPLNVVFNVLGHGNVLIDDQSTLSGSIVAQNRAVGVCDGSTVIGNVTAVHVNLTNGSTIQPPQVVSP